jgi:hypothetical protein
MEVLDLLPLQKAPNRVTKAQTIELTFPYNTVLWVLPVQPTCSSVKLSGGVAAVQPTCSSAKLSGGVVRVSSAG